MSLSWASKVLKRTVQHPFDLKYLVIGAVFGALAKAIHIERAANRRLMDTALDAVGVTSEGDNVENSDGSRLSSTPLDVVLEWSIPLQAIFQWFGGRSTNRDTVNDHHNESNCSVSASSLEIFRNHVAREPLIAPAMALFAASALLALRQLAPKRTLVALVPPQRQVISDSEQTSDPELLRLSAIVNKANGRRLHARAELSRLLGTELLQQIEEPTTALELNGYERQVAANVLDPDSMEGFFGDVEGLESVRQQLYYQVVVPLLLPVTVRRSHPLLKPPKGVLLYGPPGIGKALLAKGIAQESHSVFLSLQGSTILASVGGDSTMLLKACFTLAHKLNPSVIFIPEIDMLLGDSQSSNQVTLKANLLTLWNDTSSGSEVIVVGTSSRPHAIDAAIARRLSLKVQVTTPDAASRYRILLELLRNQDVDDTITEAALRDFAERTWVFHR
jgi:ATPase family associated with various cellular activities (AAA)